MLSALVAATLIAQQPTAQKKTVLPNGVAIHCERAEGAPSFTLHLFASALGAPEQEGRRGYRHLVEHLVSKGRKGDLDARLEAVGLFLTADTLQDGIRIEIEGSPQHANTAIEALRELLEFPSVSEEQVAREVGIVLEETGVRTPAARLFAGLYAAAFASPDPMGAPEDLAKATPEALKEVYAELFAPARLSVALVGDVDPNDAAMRLTEVFHALRGPDRPAKQERRLVSTTPGFVGDAPGSGRGALIGSMSRQDTLDTMAAAFAIASEVADAQVMVTVSPLGGLVAVVHPSREGLDGVDDLVARESNRLYKTGLATVRLWAETAAATPREKARAYGQMGLLEGFFRMEDHVRRAAAVSQAGFVEALKKFDSRNCVRVGGVR